MDYWVMPLSMLTTEPVVKVDASDAMKDTKPEISSGVAFSFPASRGSRHGTDPVVLIKMVLIQHLFGILSLRQTHREIQLNNAYRWLLGYSLLDEIPHFSTVSYAFCKRFPEELATEIFEHILIFTEKPPFLLSLNDGSSTV